MSWNKHNLYALSQKKLPSIHNQTFFQQKWLAEKETRSYHGEGLQAHIFAKAFEPRLNGVIGKFIGTKGENELDHRPLPLSSQTYACLEKRLDVAIFRSMFASSFYQARQFVIHGKVKVNGRKVTKPSTSLSPGDMYQVEPKLVQMAVSDYHHGKSLQRELVKENSSSGEDGKAADIIKHETSSSELDLQTPSKLDNKGKYDIEYKDSKNTTINLSTTTTPAKNNDNRDKILFFLNHISRPFLSYMLISKFRILPVLEYVRHPAARPGLVEVPSPFPPALHSLAYSYFIRRGR